MAVLVTGGAGYIGSHMLFALLDAGETVVALDNLATGFDWSVPEDVPLIVGDIQDCELVSNIIADHDIEEVMHFAGSTSLAESVVDPLKYFDNNSGRSRALIGTMVKAGVKRMIFSSTAAVYGNNDTGMVYEDATLEPISPYGVSKMMTEMMLRDVSLAHEFNYVALRYFNVAGADPKGRTGQASPLATQLIKLTTQVACGKRPHLEVFGKDWPSPDGTCIRDYIHVSDLVTAHLESLNYLRGGGEPQIINCGYGKGYSVLDVVSTVKRISGHDFDVRVVGRRDGDVVELVAGTDKIRSLLNWKPQYDSLDQIVSDSLAWEHRLSEMNR